MGRYVNYWGLVVAGIGFGLTRFTVTLALYEEPARFFLAGLLPLALGLALSAFGVALAVADVDADLVRTTAVWCVVGAATMLVLVVITLLGSDPDGMADLTTARSRAYLSNFLIGGSVGGTLTGLYAGRNRRQRRDLERQANRLVVLNRLLRHEILNAVTAIRGYASVSEDHPDAQSVIERRSADIERTIDEVRYLTRGEGGRTATRGSVALDDALAESVETVADRHPDATVAVDSGPEDLVVRGNERLSDVFAQLIENAVVHGDDDAPAVSVSTVGDRVCVEIADDGPGLPDAERRLLETGDIGEFDDPDTGFGLNIVRLLVESYGGDIETSVDDTGTEITVVLPRVASDASDPRPLRSDLTAVRPALPHLLVTMGAALVAGVVYGVVSEMLGGSIAGIGVFYGTADPVVGWLTHEFHSVVFGFAFVALVSMAPDRYHDRFWAYVGIGAAWGLVLWVVAAGLVAPVWLRLLGIDAAVPYLPPRLLATHLVWGVSLGALTAWGYRYAPWLRDVRQRLGRPSGS